MQVSEEVMLTRSDEDDLKVKALEYAAAPGQRVWVKVRAAAAQAHVRDTASVLLQTPSC